MTDINAPLFNLKSIPAKPGVYLMRDAAARIIYVGKAGNLRKRLAFYARGGDVGPKIQAMLEQVRHIEYVICENEREALLLEENWIKKYQPVFNAIWKDDKSYPYVVLTLREDFPRVYLARRKHIPPDAKVFGPYPDAGRVRSLIQDLFNSGILPLRPCNWDFSLKKPLASRLIHSCLYFQSGQCPAPCANRISRTKYRAIAKKVDYLFSGKHKRFAQSLRASMKEAAKNLEFERAAAIKRHLETLEHIRQSVRISAVLPQDIDSLYLPEAALESLKKALQLPETPAHMECFDISNLSGTYSTASSVCFLNGRPHKKHYRHFRIKSIKGINDFAMIEEAVRRRYSRMTAEGEDLPNLVLIDGGLGQLSAAKKALEKLTDSRGINLVSLAKREEILYLDTPQGPREIKLDKTHAGLKLCMWIRDEAHRFAIKYHRKLRDKMV